MLKYWNISNYLIHDRFKSVIKERQPTISKRNLLEYQDPLIIDWMVRLEKVEKEIPILRSEVDEMVRIAYYQAPTKLCDRIHETHKRTFEDIFSKS